MYYIEVKPWQAGLLTYLIVGLVALAISPAAGGLIGLAAGVCAYLIQKRRLQEPTATEPHQ